MSARYDEDLAALVIEDTDGDRFTVEARQQPSASAVRLFVTQCGHPVAVTLEDGLTLLSFLADALGVERYVPEVTP